MLLFWDIVNVYTCILLLHCKVQIYNYMTQVLSVNITMYHNAHQLHWCLVCLCILYARSYYMVEINTYKQQTGWHRLAHSGNLSTIDKTIVTLSCLALGTLKFKSYKMFRTLLTKSRKYDHITPVLQNLHWLTVKKKQISKC